MIVKFDFCLQRYFAQRFPPLLKTTELYMSRESSIFSWPIDRQEWQLTKSERTQLTAILKSMPPAIEICEDATVAEVLLKFDQWLIKALRDDNPLPTAARKSLTLWLASQWKLYTNLDLPDEYLWEYLTTLSDGACTINGRRGCIPPLIGSVQVYAYRKVCYDEKEWVNDKSPVHLCDQLGELFRPCYDDKQVPIYDQNRKRVLQSILAQPAYLQIDYRLGGITRNWLDEMAGFGYWPGAWHPSEHWLLRQQEVQAVRAERMLSMTVPSRLARSIAKKSPKAYGTLIRIGAAALGAHSSVLLPIWANENFIANANRWSNDQARSTPGGRRRRNLRFQSFLNDGSPEHDQRRDALREFGMHSDKHSSQFNWVDTGIIKYEQFFSRWEVAKAFATEAAMAKLQHRDVWRQELFEMHREATQILETLFRLRLREDDFAPKKRSKNGRLEAITRVNELLTHWIQKRQPGIKDVFQNVIEPYFRKPGCSNIARPVPLARLIRDTLVKARTTSASKTQKAHVFGNHVANIVNHIEAVCDGPTASPTSSLQAWRKCLNEVADGNNSGIADVLLAARLLIEIRNMLAHGTAAVEQPFENEALVVNYGESFDKAFSARLDLQSLMLCYFLIIFAACGLHNTDSPPTEWLIRNWLIKFAQNDSDLQVLEYPRNHWTAAQPETVACLYRKSTASKMTSDNEDVDNLFTTLRPELVIEVAPSFLRYDAEAKVRHYQLHGVREFLLVIPSEGQCIWHVLNVNPIKSIEPDCEGRITSEVFPNLSLDLQALLRHH